MSLERWALDPESHWPIGPRPTYRPVHICKVDMYCLQCGKQNPMPNGIGGCCSVVCHDILCDREDCE